MIPSFSLVAEVGSRWYVQLSHITRWPDSAFSTSCSIEYSSMHQQKSALVSRHYVALKHRQKVCKLNVSVLFKNAITLSTKLGLERNPSTFS